MWKARGCWRFRNLRFSGTYVNRVRSTGFVFRKIWPERTTLLQSRPSVTREGRCALRFSSSLAEGGASAALPSRATSRTQAEITKLNMAWAPSAPPETDGADRQLELGGCDGLGCARGLSLAGALFLRQWQRRRGLCHLGGPAEQQAGT